VDIPPGPAAGERVVLAGQLRLVPGARVDVKPAAAAETKAGAKTLQ
jgi:hypothetical protein